MHDSTSKQNDTTIETDQFEFEASTAQTYHCIFMSSNPTCGNTLQLGWHLTETGKVLTHGQIGCSIARLTLFGMHTIHKECPELLLTC